MSKFWVLIGSFSPLITTLQFTPNPPSLSLVSQFTAGGNPSWLLNSPKVPTTIYATDEGDTGSINSFTLNLGSGNLTKLATVPTQGGAPTHLGFVNNGAALGAANFGTGSAFIVNLDSTGSGQFSGGDSLVPFQGSGPLPNQASPHAHQVGMVYQSRPLPTSLQTALFFQVVPYGKEVLVADLGSDKIWRLTQDGSTWSIKGSIDQPAGSGPRHLVVVGTS